MSETLEDYFRRELSEGKIDFRLRVTLDSDNRPQFYLHPLDRDGQTVDFCVEGNDLKPV